MVRCQTASSLRYVCDGCAPRQRGLGRSERLGLLAGHPAHDDGGVLLDELAVIVPLCSAVQKADGAGGGNDGTIVGLELASSGSRLAARRANLGQFLPR